MPGITAQLSSSPLDPLKQPTISSKDPHNEPRMHLVHHASAINTDASLVLMCMTEWTPHCGQHSRARRLLHHHRLSLPRTHAPTHSGPLRARQTLGPTRHHGGQRQVDAFP